MGEGQWGGTRCQVNMNQGKVSWLPVFLNVLLCSEPHRWSFLSYLPRWNKVFTFFCHFLWAENQYLLPPFSMKFQYVYSTFISEWLSEIMLYTINDGVKNHVGMLLCYPGYICSKNRAVFFIFRLLFRSLPFCSRLVLTSEFSFASWVEWGNLTAQDNLN